MANRRTLEEQIEQALKELKQKEARIRELKQRQRSRSDKTRTHRLCKRGGLVESLLPRLAKFTDEQFETWVKKILMSENSLRLIDQLLLPVSDDAETEALPTQEEITTEPETADVPEQAPAPPEYADRAVLWNAVEKIEKHSRAQLDPKKRQAFYDKHADEIESYEKSKAYLDKIMNGKSPVPTKEWRKELQEKTAEKYALYDKFYKLRDDVKNVEILRRRAEQIMSGHVQEHTQQRDRGIER